LDLFDNEYSQLDHLHGNLPRVPTPSEAITTTTTMEHEDSTQRRADIWLASTITDEPHAPTVDDARFWARQTATWRLLRAERRLRRNLAALGPQAHAHWQAARDELAERGVRLPDASSVPSHRRSP
jgi:hypothetical protein